MNYLKFETVPLGDTVDPLIDYATEHAPLSAEASAIVAEAWDQHDAYMGASTTGLRKYIVAQAIADLGKLHQAPVQHSDPIPYILRKAHGTGSMTAELLVQQTKSSQRKNSGHHIGLLNFFASNHDFDPAATKKAVEALLPICDAETQDQLLDAHAVWVAADPSRQLPASRIADPANPLTVQSLQITS